MTRSVAMASRRAQAASSQRSQIPSLLQVEENYQCIQETLEEPLSYNLTDICTDAVQLKEYICTLKLCARNFNKISREYSLRLVSSAASFVEAQTVR